MEKRIGTAIIRIVDRQNVDYLNSILSNHASLIIGRQGLPRIDGTSLISLVLEGTTDEIGSLTGQIGRLEGIEIKSVLLKNSE
ncbi:MAG: TM1266 family iron-only hydrogenase system putative regulator [Bacteroidales bacterium]